MASRNYQLTLNQVEKFESLKGYILKFKNLQYGIACEEEAPLTGHKHIHIYIQFNKPQRLSTKKTEGAHIEKCYGTPEENKKYIEKDGKIIWEYGEMKTNEKTRFPTIKEVKEMTKEQRDLLPIQYYRIVNEINSKEAKEIKVNDIYKEIYVEWHWGESGSGKTKTIMQNLKDKTFNMVKFDGNFWHGLGEAEIAVYDDWRDNHMKPVELINFIDYYKHPMNIKGGSHLNNYKYIYISSIQNPETIYQNTPEEYKRQWLRRIKLIINHKII